MSTTQKAMGVLIEAEAVLRKLMEEGIREHRYSEVAEIADLADALTKLLIPRGAPREVPALTPDSPPAARLPRTPTRAAVREKNKTNYPQFKRDGDKLVKIGWSKKHREQYEHRAPRDTVASVARHLGRQVKVGHVFELEELLPVLDSANGEIPVYQVYLTMAWLRAEGAVEKKGRDGHVLRDASIAASGFDKLWEGVPKRAT